MTDFIYNDNTERRGVWHVTENLEVTLHPASETSYPRRYSNDGETIVLAKPEYETAKGDAICGQVTCRTGGVDSRWGDYSRKASIVDGVRTIRHRIQPAHYQRDPATSPSPLCSRCEAKAGLA